jgi:hypothetical protein
MRDLRPDELSHVYGGDNAAKTNPKGTNNHNSDRNPAGTKGADKKKSTG